MNQFYTSDIQSSKAHFGEDESQHLRVLRLQEGDEINIVDGRGKQFKGVLTKLHKKASEAELLELIKESPSRPLIDIAIAPTKSNDRIEWFIEKATEIGVGHIYPFTSYHSERKVIKPERWNKIALSGMKQSLRLWLPVIEPIKSFEALVQSDLPHANKMLAHLKTDQLHMKDVMNTSDRTLVFIGPEGGFSDVEIEMAEKAGCRSITLGSTRYRTETAGIVAVTVFNQELG